jgi:acyl carrier protein
MSNDEKLELIERVLFVEPNTLMPETQLSDVPQWDSLSMLNMQIELTVFKPELSFDELRECKTVGDICALMG